MTKNIMIVGVGGQGTLLTSRILGGIMSDAGYEVKVSEVHGMAQRGGSVVTFVRYGDRVAEPIVEEGQADVLIAFERLEAGGACEESHHVFHRRPGKGPGAGQQPGIQHYRARHGCKAHGFLRGRVA